MISAAENSNVANSRRKVEIQLVLFAQLIVCFGLFLVVSGKLGTVAPLPLNSININTASAADFATSLGIGAGEAASVIQFRDKLPGHRFSSAYSLKRYLSKQNTPYLWAWQSVYVRSLQEIVAHCVFSALFLELASFLILFCISRSAPRADPFLLPIVILLSGIGLIVSISVHDPYRDTFAFDNQAVGVILFGTIALLVPLLKAYGQLPLHRYTYAYAGAALVLLVTLMILGRGPAATHIELFGFEPIEFIKVLLVFFIASYLADRRISAPDRITTRSYLPNMRDVLPLIGIYVFALSLFGAVKDLGPAVLLFGTFVAMLYLVTGNWTYPLAGFVLLLAAGYVGDKLGIGFFATRVEMWLHPWNNGNRLGGQLAEGLWGLATGGIFGSGLGLGGSYNVPRAGSDMIFTTIGEETGLTGAVLTLCLYSVLIFRGFQIAKRTAGDFDRLVAAGITILIGLQAFVIAGGATGVMPLTGITLPFVAYGTSSLVANYFCIGVLLYISSKTIGSDVDSIAPPVFKRTTRHIAVGLTAGLLIVIGIARLGWLQAINDKATATSILSIPDADRVVRPHSNPRLIDFASSIPRGSIFDRDGVLLAANTPPGTAGVTYLTGGTPRRYPCGPVAADVVYAVEQPRSETDPLGADTELRGYDSFSDLLSSYRRKDLPFPPSLRGQDVKLTLDVKLQEAVQASLERNATEFGNGRGAAVVLDCKTGALLAAATAPTFDPNTLDASSWTYLHSSTDPNQPLLNRVFAGQYPPGSVFKLVTATSALLDNKQDLVFECHHTLPELEWRFDGKRYIRRHVTDDEEFVPHGQTDMAKAIRVSCNVYFAQLGVVLGAPALEHTIKSYGLFDCPNLATLGLDLPDCAYGQGTILVTPYQMARVCQTIGNRGVYAGQKFFVNSPLLTVGKRVLPQDDANQIKAMMAGVVTNGTAVGVFPGMSVAGKTGSAELNHGKPHSWFVGVAPVDDPQIAFACIIEHGGHGRTAAGPVCRDIVANSIK